MEFNRCWQLWLSIISYLSHYSNLCPFIFLSELNTKNGLVSWEYKNNKYFSTEFFHFLWLHLSIRNSNISKFLFTPLYSYLPFNLSFNVSWYPTSMPVSMSFIFIPPYPVYVYTYFFLVFFSFLTLFHFLFFLPLLPPLSCYSQFLSNQYYCIVFSKV